MLDYVEKLEVLRKKLQDIAEAEKDAFFEERKTQIAMLEHEREAKFQSGLLNRQKYKKYVEWLRNNQPKIPKTNEPDQKQIERVRERYKTHFNNVLNNRYRCDTGPQPKDIKYLYIPQYTLHDHSETMEVWPSYSDVTSNTAKLKIQPMSCWETDPDSGKTTTPLIMGNAWAFFNYTIPANKIPPYGGTIKVTPFLNFFGSYAASCRQEGWGQGDYLFMDAQYIMSVDAHGDSDNTDYTSLPGFPIESKPDYAISKGDLNYSRSKFAGASVTLDVEPGDGQVWFYVSIEGRTSGPPGATGGGISIPGNFADIDFAENGYPNVNHYFQVEKIQIDWIKCNGPPQPPTAHYEGYPKPWEPLDPFEGLEEKLSRAKRI